MSRDSIIYEKSRRFASRIVRLHSHLLKEKDEHVISAQVVRSGTSIGANVAEALYASSRRDFLSKVTISMKECSETLYWLDILNDNGYLVDDKARSIITDCEEIMKMLVATVRKVKEVSPYEAREADDESSFSNPLNLNPVSAEVPDDSL